MPDTVGKERPKAVILLHIAAWMFLAAGVVFNEFVADWISLAHGLHPVTVIKVRVTQLVFIIIAAMIFTLTYLICKNTRSRKLFERPRSINFSLLFTAVITPVAILELALRAFLIHALVYQGDWELGWRLRANAESIVEETMIRINSEGFRGPVVPFERTKGKQRILYLGDSIPFGFRIENHEETFPFLTGRELERLTGIDVETVNLSVTGYSPWQENIILRRKGVYYKPDLVVLCITINDFTDKFERLILDRGDTIPGGQGLIPSLYVKLARISGILYFTKVYFNRDRYLLDTEEAESRHREYVDLLLNHREDKLVRSAWQMTLKNIETIFTFCSVRRIPVLLLLFPFDFQLAQPPETSSPQSVIIRSAYEYHVPFLDLLPLFREKMESEKLQVRDAFMDVCHPNRKGHQWVAQFLAEFIVEEKMIQPRETNMDDNIDESEIPGISEPTGER